MKNKKFIITSIIIILISFIFLFYPSIYFNLEEEFTENNRDILKFNKKIDISVSYLDIDKNIFYPSNCCISKDKNNNYILIIRMINYKIENGEQVFTNVNTKINISINKIIKLDKYFNIIDENKLIIPELFNNLNKNILGIEDIRIFNYNNSLKILGSSQIDNKIKIVSGEYNYDKNVLLNVNFIENTFNQTDIEKNWVYFKNNEEELNIVYKWYPLHICKLNDNKLILLKTIDMPIFFENTRGSTCGIQYNNEIWFISHFNENMNYFHFFVVFDKNMKLKKYSNKFKFEGYKIEFCLGLLIENNNIIISYSLNDANPKIGVYNISNIKELEWYDI